MGVTTAAEVCNLGLTAIGHTAFIDALDDNSVEAQVANANYDQAVEACLERFPWKFATRRATLAMVAGPSVNESLLRNGWTYVYAIPADCVSVRHVTVDGIRAPSPEQRIPCEVESDDTGGRGSVTGKVLLTDQIDAELVYTARVDTVALWSGLFVDALRWKLAAVFALAIQKKPAVAASMEQMFERALMIAGASQSRQGTEDRPPNSEFIAVR